MESYKILTDNPLMDNLIYHVKTLGLKTILKDQTKADKYETVRSVKDADLYLACCNGIASFNSFGNFTREQLQKAFIPDNILEDCVTDKFNIPLALRDRVTKIAIKDTIDNYVETNKYYLNTAGRPAEDDPIIYVDEVVSEVDTSKPVHEMSDIEVQILEAVGILDKLKKQYPQADYLNFLADKRISYAAARIAPAFSILYIPSSVPVEISSKFKYKLESVRVYTLKCVYSEAFKNGSDYYDNFIMLFIKLQTMNDIIVELPDFIIRRDLFDIQSIKFMFESSGVDFFEDIPIKYQLRMIKNLNKLIKYKSTTKNIVDICSLFGFPDINIFKYYLLKDRKHDASGDYIFEYTKDPITQEYVEDYDKMYDLKFVRVPIDDELDNHIRDSSNHVRYEEMTADDPYWATRGTEELIKQQILKQEFSVVQSKYLSIDTLYDMSKLSFELTYFFNMIFDKHNVEEGIRVSCPFISTIRGFRLLDLIVYLYVLMYEMNGIVDNIFDSQSKILYVMGFNFDADLNAIQNDMLNKGYTLEQLGVDKFMIPKSVYTSFNQMVEVYTTNKKIHDHLCKQMENAETIEMYRIYKTLYDSLMISELTTEIFKDSEGHVYKTYTDWLHDRDILLHQNIIKIRSQEPVDKVSLVQESMGYVISALVDLTEHNDFTYIFGNIPSISSETIKKYIFKVVNFFKSYKVDLSNINNIYVFNDKLENRTYFIDQIRQMDTTFNPNEYDITIDVMKDLISKMSTTVDAGFIDLINNLIITLEGKANAEPNCNFGVEKVTLEEHSFDNHQFMTKNITLCDTVLEDKCTNRDMLDISYFYE